MNGKGNWFLFLVIEWHFLFKYIYFLLRCNKSIAAGWGRGEKEKKKSTPSEFNIALPFDPAIPLLDVYPNK